MYNIKPYIYNYMNLDLYIKTLWRGLTQVGPPREKKKKLICNKI